MYNLDVARVALRARINALELGAEEGLSELGERTDPESVLRRLQILIDAERFKDAANAVENLVPHFRWCDKAIFAISASGEIDKALELLEWSDSLENHPIRQRCALQFASGALYSAGAQSQHNLNPHMLDERAKSIICQAIDALTRITKVVEAHNRIESPLEEKGVSLAAVSAWLIGENTLCRKYGDFLKSQSTVSPYYVRLVGLKALDATADLPDRIWLSHPDDLDMQLAALRIEGIILGDSISAFSRAQKLANSLASPNFQNLKDGNATETDDYSEVDEDHLETLFWTMRELSERVGGVSKRIVSEFAGTLLKENSSTQKLHKALDYLSSSKPDNAFIELSSIEDTNDPMWLQANAHALWQQGKKQAAAQRLIEASKLLKYDDTLWLWAASAAFEAKQFELAQEALKAILAFKPDDEDALRNLGVVLSIQEDYIGAGKCFEILRTVKEDCAYEAIRCFAYGGDPEHALKLTQEMIEEFPLKAKPKFWRSELLMRNGQPLDAFTLLKSIRETHWDDPGFVQRYLHVAYAAGKDKDGDEALGQLKTLRDREELPEQILETVSIENFLKQVQDQAQLRKMMCTNIVGGQIPWYTADLSHGKAGLWGWRERSQELRWLNEAQHVRGECSIFATNRYSVKSAQGPERTSLETILCSVRGSSVVVDLSALITLSRLEILERAEQYFDRILVPACYSRLSYEERDLLQIHQLSRAEIMANLKYQLDIGRLRLLSTAPSEDEITLVHVIDDDEAPAGALGTISTINLVEILHTHGLIGDEILAVANQHFSNSHNGNAPLNSIRKGSALRAEASVLTSLATLGCLDALLSFFSVYVDDDARHEIIQTDLHYRALDETRKWHDQLWRALRESKTYEFTTSGTASEEGSTLDYGLAALQLSKEQGLPLLADDRLFQVDRQSDDDGRLGAASAFGTDALLLEMHREGILTVDELTTLYLRLMKWRYRFLLPPLEVLLHCAGMRRDNPPGDRLVQIASYLHDCIHDPGLFSGAELDEKPSSMSSRFAGEWAGLTSKFVAAIWKDKALSDASAEILTKWAARTLLPSIPHGIGREGFEVSLNLNRALPSLAVLHALEEMEDSRVHKGLTWLASTLGFSQDEILDLGLMLIATDIADDEPDVEQAFGTLVIQNVFGDQVTLTRKQASLLRMRELLHSEKFPELDAEAASAIGTAISADKTGPHNGPLLFIERQTGNPEVLAVRDVLFSENTLHRTMASSYFTSLSRRMRNSICDFTLTKISESEGDLNSDSSKIWTRTAVALHELIGTDFLLNLAATRQSFKYSFSEGIDEYVRAILLPSLDGLNGLPVRFLLPSTQKVDIATFMTELALKSETLEDLLNSYYEACGHLPLNGELSLAAVVRDWTRRDTLRNLSAESLWKWADDKTTPLAIYHICQVLCCNLGILTERDAERFWSEVGAIVHTSTGLDGPAMARSENWVLLNRLAQHFCRHIENQNWCSNGEAAASLAWWMADQVATLFIEDEQDIQKVIDQLEKGFFSRVMEQWTLIRPVVEPSLFRYATVSVRTPWGLAILGQLSHANSVLSARFFACSSSQEIVRALAGSMWHAYRFSPVERTVFAMDPACINEIAGSIGNVESEDYNLQILKVMCNGVNAISESGLLVDRMLQLEKASEADSVMVLHGFSFLLYTSRESISVLKDVLEAPGKWIEPLILDSPSNVVENLFDGLMELLGTGHPSRASKPRWFYEMPHVFCEACLKKTEDEERRNLLFSMLIILCLKTDTTSAIQRLLASDLRLKFTSEIEDWQKRLDYQRCYGSSAMAARIRPVLLALEN